MTSATIKLLLPYGDAKHPRVDEVSSWTGKALAAPRTAFDDVLLREEDETAGVYFRFGSDSESGDALLPKVVIRPQTSTDMDAIVQVTKAAFATLEISVHAAPFTVVAPHAAGAPMEAGLARMNALAFDGHIHRGTVAFHQGFEATG